MISQLPNFQFHNLCQCNSEVFLKLDQIATESTESVVLVAIKNTSKIDQFQKFSETINLALTNWLLSKSADWFLYDGKIDR